MNWDHLTYFRKAVEVQNLTLAAKSLYISPAALSKAISSLEAEIGFPLFKKQGRNSVLTEYGIIFYDHVVTALDEVDKGLQSVYSRVGLVKGHVRISGNWTMCNGFLPEQIKAFRKLHPEVSYFTKYQITSQVIRSVITRVSDLGLCGDFDVDEDDHSELERRLLYKEDLAMIVPNDHWMAKIEFVNFNDLRDEDFVSFRAVNSGGVFEALQKLCLQHEFQPRIVFEANDDPTVVSFVATGLGIAMVPYSKYLPLKDVVVVPFKENSPVRHQYIIWRKNDYLAPVAKAFRDFIIANNMC